MNRKAMRLAAAEPTLEPVLRGADHVDVKTVETEVRLAPFVTGMLAYQPAWMSALSGSRTPTTPIAPCKQR